jgi:hypothetical protein
VRFIGNVSGLTLLPACKVTVQVFMFSVSLRRQLCFDQRCCVSRRGCCGKKTLGNDRAWGLLLYFLPAQSVFVSENYHCQHFWEMNGYMTGGECRQMCWREVRVATACGWTFSVHCSFACFSYRRFIAKCCRFRFPTCIHELLSITEWFKWENC